MSERGRTARARSGARYQPGAVGRRRPARQRGTVSVLSAVSLLALIGIGAFAVEVATLMVARNELQNAADATAMAGAACLAGRTECGNAGIRKPDWDTATLRAQAFVSSNKVQGLALVQGSVATGYWNMLAAAGDLQSNTIQPTDYDYPAIQVTVSREPGINGGSLVTPLAQLFGVNTAALRASAVAVLSYPGTAPAGTLFPVAVSRCMYETFWDTSARAPVLATQVSMPGLDLPQVVGEPIRFKVTSSYRAGPCESGQWTSFQTGIADANANDLNSLLSGGSGQSLSTGDGSWIVNGKKTKLYEGVNTCSEAGNQQCAYVMAPVVDSLVTGSFAPVRGFACLRILSATKDGNSPYIVAQMSASEDRCPSLGSGVGPNYGISTPPRLVQ